MSAMSLGFVSNGPRKLGSVKVPAKYFNRISTGNSNLDEIFGNGGFIAGQCISMTASRGAGKTTFWLQVMDEVIVNSGKRCLYLSGEEYIEQLAFTAQRIGVKNVEADNVTEVDAICKLTKTYDMICIDSLASVTKNGKGLTNGGSAHAVQEICKAAKSNDCIVVFILHLTKQGKVKGDSSVEHTVDACLQIVNLNPEEYAPGEKAFIVSKNRFGACDDHKFTLTKFGWDFGSEGDDTSFVPVTKKKGGRKGGVKKSFYTKFVEIIKAAPRGVVKAGEVIELFNDKEKAKFYLGQMVREGLLNKTGRGDNATLRLAS